MYNNQEIVKAFGAAAIILPYTIVKFDTTDNNVKTTALAADLSIGVTTELGIDADGVTKGASVDVVISGIAEIVAGAAITRGQRLTSNATGQAVTGAAGNQCIGVAMMSAVAGDVIPVLLTQSTI